MWRSWLLCCFIIIGPKPALAIKPVVLAPTSAFRCDLLNQSHFFAYHIPSSVHQLLVVKTIGERALISICHKSQREWQASKFTAIPAFIGANGVAAYGAKREGDHKTPSGLYALGTAFGIDPLTLNYPYRQLDASDKFIDDPISPAYNSWVHGPTSARSYEPMLKYYRLGIVIKYNMNPVIRGAGSAIFIHNLNLPQKSTQGCVGMQESDLLSILKWLNKRAHPAILIY